MTSHTVTSSFDQDSLDRIIDDLNANYVVPTGAGTGKTYALVSRVVALVKSGVSMAKSWPLPLQKPLLQSCRSAYVHVWSNSWILATRIMQRICFTPI